jgi:dTDP-4-dehydrorhamnose reductase
MKVLILGASGIVGQHMRLCVPDCVQPVWVRRTADPITSGDCTVSQIMAIDADVIVTLWG